MDIQRLIDDALEFHLIEDDDHYSLIEVERHHATSLYFFEHMVLTKQEYITYLKWSFYEN